MKVTHIPRGFMCCECKYSLEDCSSLDFTQMKVIGTFKDDGVKEVRCSKFNKASKEEENYK